MSTGKLKNNAQPYNNHATFVNRNLGFIIFADPKTFESESGNYETLSTYKKAPFQFISSGIERTYVDFI